MRKSTAIYYNLSIIIYMFDLVFWQARGCYVTGRATVAVLKKSGVKADGLTDEVEHSGMLTNERNCRQVV
jgi:hypothetical protein